VYRVSADTDLLMLTQGTVVTLSHYPVCTHRKSSHCELDGRLGGPESWSGLFRQEEILCFCHDLNPSIYSSLVGILTATSWLLYIVQKMFRDEIRLCVLSSLLENHPVVLSIITLCYHIIIV